MGADKITEHSSNEQYLTLSRIIVSVVWLGSVYMPEPVSEECS